MFGECPLCDNDSQWGTTFLDHIWSNIVSSTFNAHLLLLFIFWTILVWATKPKPPTWLPTPRRTISREQPDQVFKFDNFLTHLMGGTETNTIAAIGTINPGSLCLQYLYDPQIQYNLLGEPIAFIENSSNKNGKFSMIMINVEFIHFFAYIEDKATWDTSFTEMTFVMSSSPTLFGRISTNPSLLVLPSQLFLANFGQDVPYGDISNDEIMMKLTRLVTGFDPSWITFLRYCNVSKMEKLSIYLRL